MGDSDLEQGSSMLEYARELFPLPPRELPSVHGKGGMDGKGGKGGKGVRLGARLHSWEQTAAKHEAQWHHIAFHFVKTVQAHPKLLGIVSAKDALCALDPVINRFNHNRDRYDHFLDRMTMQSLEKMRHQTNEGLKKLMRIVQSLDLGPAAASDRAERAPIAHSPASRASDIDP